MYQSLSLILYPFLLYLPHTLKGFLSFPSQSEEYPRTADTLCIANSTAPFPHFLLLSLHSSKLRNSCPPHVIDAWR